MLKKAAHLKNMIADQLKIKVSENEQSNFRKKLQSGDIINWQDFTQMNEKYRETFKQEAVQEYH